MSVLTIWKKPGWRGVLLGMLCAVAAWGLTRWPPLGSLEEWLQDGAFTFRAERFSRAKVFLIGLDDQSLDNLGKPLVFTSPEIAKVVIFAHGQGAAAIGLDMIIPNSLMKLPDLLEDGRGDATKLGHAIKDAGNVVLADWYLEKGWLEPLLQWQTKYLVQPGPTDFGFVNLTEDDDIHVRRQQLLIKVKDKDGEHAKMHFSLALFAQAQGVGEKVEWDDASKVLRLDREVVPLDDQQTLRINFVGPPGTFPIIPLSRVLDAAAKGEQWAKLKGSIVIIGVSARSQQDYHATPYASNYWRTLYASSPGLMSGMEIHANILATLDDRAYIVTPAWWASMGILLSVGALLGRAFAVLNLGWGLVVVLGHHVGWKYLCFAGPAYFHCRIEIVAMLFLGILLYGVTFVQRWWVLRRMLGVVKSEAIAHLLENDPGQLDQRGEDRVATLLFADIRNFTGFSEKRAAREVVALLNTYFTAVVPIIENHGGTLNQYMGDGVMVIFGVPINRQDHALQAVRAAVAIVKQVHLLKERWAELGFPGMRIGVGIHTGNVVAGSVGSPHRLDYTVIGDTVNTASRIEAKNKELGTEILISSDTFRDLPSNERQVLGCAIEGTAAAVKGKQQPLILHAVVPAEA